MTLCVGQKTDSSDCGNREGDKNGRTLGLQDQNVEIVSVVEMERVDAGWQEKTDHRVDWGEWVYKMVAFAEPDPPKIKDLVLDQNIVGTNRRRRLVIVVTTLSLL